MDEQHREWPRWCWKRQQHHKGLRYWHRGHHASSRMEILGNIVDGHWHIQWQKPTIRYPFGHCDEYRFEDVPGPAGLLCVHGDRVHVMQRLFVLFHFFLDRDCPSSAIKWSSVYEFRTETCRVRTKIVWIESYDQGLVGLFSCGLAWYKLENWIMHQQLISCFDSTQSSIIRHQLMIWWLMLNVGNCTLSVMF